MALGEGNHNQSWIQASEFIQRAFHVRISLKLGPDDQPLSF